MKSSENDNNSERSAERILDLLELTVRSQDPMTLSEITQRSGLSKTTVHRLLKTLCRRGYLIKSPSGRYYCGYMVTQLASLHINSLELQTAALPYLTELHDRLGLTVQFGRIREGKIILLGRVGDITEISHTEIATDNPIYPSSIGKCMLSALSGEELDIILAEKPLERYTASTITDTRAYRVHLWEVRRNGWAIDNCEYLPDRRNIGAPVFDYRSTCVGAVSVSGSIAEISSEKLPAVIEAVKDTGRQISLQLGYPS